jgi:hypothetical protein
MEFFTFSQIVDQLAESQQSWFKEKVLLPKKESHQDADLELQLIMLLLKQKFSHIQD